MVNTRIYSARVIVLYMSALDAYVSAPEAARRLRVDPSRIRVLAESDRLNATKKAGRWMIEASSVAQYERSGRHPGRGLTAPNAWSVIALASGEPTPWLRASERYRMRLMLNRDGLTHRPRRSNASAR